MSISKQINVNHPRNKNRRPEQQKARNEIAQVLKAQKPNF
jgi:hypothetical protein